MAIEDIGTAAAFFGAVTESGKSQREQEEDRAFKYALTDMALRAKSEILAQGAVLQGMLERRNTVETESRTTIKRANEILKMMGAAESDPSTSPDMIQILQSNYDNEIAVGDSLATSFTSINNTIKRISKDIEMTRSRTKHLEDITTSFDAGESSGIGTTLAARAREKGGDAVTERWTVTRKEAIDALEEMLEMGELNPVEAEKLRTDQAFREGVVRSAIGSEGVKEALQEEDLAVHRERTREMAAQRAQDAKIKPGEAINIHQLKYQSGLNRLHREMGATYNELTGELQFPEGTNMAEYQKRVLAIDESLMKDFDATMRANYGERYQSMAKDYDRIYGDIPTPELPGETQGQNAMRKLQHKVDIKFNQTALRGGVSRLLKKADPEIDIPARERVKIVDDLIKLVIEDLTEENRGELPSSAQVWEAMESAFENPEKAKSIIDWVSENRKAPYRTELKGF